MDSLSVSLLWKPTERSLNLGYHLPFYDKAWFRRLGDWCVWFSSAEWSLISIISSNLSFPPNVSLYYSPPSIFFHTLLKPGLSSFFLYKEVSKSIQLFVTMKAGYITFPPLISTNCPKLLKVKIMSFFTILESTFHEPGEGHLAQSSLIMMNP